MSKRHRMTNKPTPNTTRSPRASSLCNEPVATRTDMDSFPPLASDDIDESVETPLSPELIARRTRARWAVGLFLGVATLFFAVGVGKTTLAARSSSLGAPASVPNRIESAFGTRVTALAHSTVVTTPEMPQPPAAVAPKADVAHEQTATSSPDPERAGKLRKQAESLLDRGRYREAIEVSREAIAADPTHALPYLYIGSALQSTGKWKDGIAAYSECVRNAKRGPVHECSALGGRK